MICLLSPTIPSYLDGLNDRMQVSDGHSFFFHRSNTLQDHMEKCPCQFDIPKEVFDHPETVKSLLSTMKDLLTVCRGAIKLKVCVVHFITVPWLIIFQLTQSLEPLGKRARPQSIVELLKSLATSIAGMTITHEHWARYAFLVRRFQSGLDGF